jgi:quercetin 2,3-dioxygenase
VGTEVRRAGSRFTTRAEGRTTRHSFSFGGHYDPANVAHGPLVAHNDDALSPGAGYDAHAHHEVEIVTWVLAGALRHEDADGRVCTARPGTVQRITAGTGVRHSEVNASTAEPVRFVQVWLRPSAPGLPPGYQLADATAELRTRGLVPVASGLAGVDAPVTLNAAAALLVGRLAAGQAVRLPAAQYLHLFVADGAVDLEDAGRLDAGDAARLSAEPARRLTALSDAEVLVWRMSGG